MVFVLYTSEIDVEKTFGTKLEHDLSLGLPLGGYPAIEIFLSRPKADKLPNEWVILNELYYVIDTMRK